MTGLWLLASLSVAGTFKVPLVNPRAFPVGGFVLPVLRPDALTVAYGPGIPVLPMSPVLSLAPKPVAPGQLNAPRPINEQLSEIAGGENSGEERKEKSDESAAADSGKLFDGSGEGPGGSIYVPPERREVPPGELPAYLSVADADDRAWLTDVVNVSQGTRTGAKILAAVEKLSGKIGRPIAVVVAELRANNGEYVYDWDMVRMARSYRKLDPFTAAPIFMHELTHVLQLAERLPVDALEMELEAHLLTLRMIRELNLRPKAGSFEDGANRALRKSAAEFVKYVLASYKDNRALSPGGIKGYIEWLTEKRKKKLRAIARVENKIQKELANIEGMRGQGHPEEAVAAYELDRIGELKRFLLEHQRALGWMDRDLQSLSTPEGVGRYRRFAERVRRMARNDQGS